MPTDHKTELKQKLRWYQYSLRTLLIIVTLFAFACSWFAVKMNQAKKQTEAVESLLKRGGIVGYDYEINSDGVRIRGAMSSIPAWLRKSLGEDFFRTATSVNLTIKELTVDKKGLWDVNYPSSSFEITDLGPLEELGGIQYLHLEQTNAGDTDLKHLTTLNRLECLLLAQTRITDTGLENLKGLKQLYTLDLSKTKVSDAGLEKLEGLTQLHNLNLSKTQVTDAGIEKLQKALPKLKIERK
jgi:hypothetical protein